MWQNGINYVIAAVNALRVCLDRTYFAELKTYC